MKELLANEWERSMRLLDVAAALCSMKMAGECEDGSEEAKAIEEYLYANDILRVGGYGENRIHLMPKLFRFCFGYGIEPDETGYLRKWYHGAEFFALLRT